nr:probable pseudouridine-5'-phosphatase [Onthophagus taurus]
MSKNIKKHQKRSNIPIWIGTLVKRKHKITHCIFDLDGTIINSEEIHQKAIKEIMLKYNKDYTIELQLNTLGRTAEEVCKILIEDGNVPISFEKCLKSFEHKTTTNLSRCKLMPGVEKLLDHLHKNNIPIALISTSTQEEIDLKLSPFVDLRKMFHHEIAGGSDKSVLRNPPFPDLLNVCVKRFCTDWENKKTLVFDDSPIGVQAANVAQMKIVLIQKLEIPKNISKATNCILDSLEEFQPENFGFPRYGE